MVAPRRFENPLMKNAEGNLTMLHSENRQVYFHLGLSYPLNIDSNFGHYYQKNELRNEMFHLALNHLGKI
jgi:hypothetical protein